MNEEFELTPEEIQEIRTLREQGLSYRNIAKKTGRSLGIIAKYCKGIRPLVLEEKDLLDYIEPKLDKINKDLEKLKENQKDLIELVFANFFSICRALDLGYDQERAELIKEKLLSSLED
jgi:predicted transcriptional regulator